MPRRQAGGDLKTTCRKSLAIFTALNIYTHRILNWMLHEAQSDLFAQLPTLNRTVNISEA
jgi:hypothetical protein